MCIVHQPHGVDTLDVVFHVAHIVCKELPLEVCALGTVLAEHISKNHSVPELKLQDEEMTKKLHMNVQVAQNINSLRMEYMTAQLKRAVGDRISKDAMSKLHGGLDSCRAKILQIDNVCGVCDADVISSAYGGMIIDLMDHGDFEIDNVTTPEKPDKTKHAASAMPAGAEGPKGLIDPRGNSFRLVSQWDLDTCGLDTDLFEKKTRGEAAHVVTSAHDLRRLCWHVASHAISSARTRLMGHVVDSDSFL